MRSIVQSITIAASCVCTLSAASLARQNAAPDPASQPIPATFPAPSIPSVAAPSDQTQPSSDPAQSPPIVPRPADETRPTRAGGGGLPGLTIELRPKIEYTFSADMRDSGASVSIFRAGLGVGMSAPVGERARLLLNVEGEWSNYDFKNYANLLPNGEDPLGSAGLLRISPGLVYQIDEKWGITGGALLEVAGAGGADLSDSITYGGYFGVRYAVSDSLNFTLGVAGKTQLEDDAIFVPLIGLQWRISEKLMLENLGLGLKLSAQVADHVRAQIFGTYELREYRLADDSAIPDGVARDARVPLGVGIEWRPNERISITAYAGAVVYQKYEFDDDSGNGVANDRTRPAAFVGFFGSIAF